MIFVRRINIKTFERVTVCHSGVRGYNEPRTLQHEGSIVRIIIIIIIYLP